MEPGDKELLREGVVDYTGLRFLRRDGASRLRHHRQVPTDHSRRCAWAVYVAAMDRVWTVAS